MTRFGRVFGDVKPVIAMVHVGATPGAPLHDEARGVEGIIADARADLASAPGGRLRRGHVRQRARPTLRAAGGRGCHRDDGLRHRPAARRDPRALRRQRAVGSERHDGPRRRDGRALSCARSSPARTPRTWALWNPDAGAALRYGRRLGAGDVVKLYNISAEFADSLDRRSLPDRARSAVFSSIPDAVLVSGAITGEPAAMSDLEAVKRVLPTTPVLANTGVKHADGGRRPARSPTASSWAPPSRSMATPGRPWTPTGPWTSWTASARREADR